MAGSVPIRYEGQVAKNPRPTPVSEALLASDKALRATGAARWHSIGKWITTFHQPKMRRATGSSFTL
jgi:hypothetical protein